MRLLHTKKLELEEFGGRDVPNYAILSHTWGKEEVTLQDIKTNEATSLQGYEKVSKACSVAAADGFDYVWIDTCCIDKTSSAELSEALNSMYRWYQEAEECYAYLADVPHHSVNRLNHVIGAEFRKSRWFTRGWTLQELIAPLSVIFLDDEWHEIGTKSNLHREISEVTRIPGGFLLGDDLKYASVAQKMSWASERETTRIEDLAYCLMGLFGIYMPMLYGEGERAFIRLQEEIMRISDDHSLFAWRSTQDHGGIFANSPAAFAYSGNIIQVSPSYSRSSPLTLSSRGIHLSLHYISNGDAQQGVGLAILHCTEIGQERKRLALYLRDVFMTNQDFVREKSTTLELVSVEDINSSQHSLTSMYVRQWHPTRKRNREVMEKCLIKLDGVEAPEAAARIVNLDSNCDYSDGVMIMNMAGISDGLVGRLVVLCKDGSLFQILLSKHGRSLSVEISTSTTDLQHIEDLDIPEKEQNEQDRIVKVLGDGRQVHVAIKKRVLLLRGERCLTGVVEVNYSSSLDGLWFEHIAVLGKKVKEKTLMSLAAKRGLKAVVEHLLDREGIDPDSMHDLRTPLSWAVEGGQDEVVKLLLKRGAETELKDKDGRTPLSRAAESGQEEVVKHLLKKGAATESRDKSGRTPLSWAAGSNQKAVVRLLLATVAVLEEYDKNIRYRKSKPRARWKWLLPAKGSKVDSNLNNGRSRRFWFLLEDMHGLTPLFYAAQNGHLEVVQLLLDKADVDAKANDGSTLLHKISSSGNLEVVQLLLDNGADITMKTRRGWTPLHKASFNGHLEVVQLLLDNGADIAVASSDGRTPLHEASSNGHLEVVQLLLGKGADIGAKTGWGWTPLLVASSNGHLEVVQLLLDKGADIAAKSSYRWTPLHLASSNGHLEIVQLLLAKGADIAMTTSNARTRDGWTPLFFASSNGHLTVVQLLLDKGADIAAKSSDRRTPLQEASSNGHLEVVRLLLDKDADIAVESRQGQTLLHKVTSDGHFRSPSYTLTREPILPHNL